MTSKNSFQKELNDFQEMLDILTKYKWDMLKLREYCKRNNIEYKDLTEEEIKMFIVEKDD